VLGDLALGDLPELGVVTTPSDGLPAHLRLLVHVERSERFNHLDRTNVLQKATVPWVSFVAAQRSGQCNAVMCMWLIGRVCMWCVGGWCPVIKLIQVFGTRSLRTRTGNE
jgi:hypothetical protein